MEFRRVLCRSPDQRSVVQQRYSGPARVRGSAGTGKTVVALHRAAELAQRYNDDSELPILFTTFIKTLPLVFEQLYDRLPNAVPNRVRFLTVAQLAFEVCRAQELGRAACRERVVKDE